MKILITGGAGYIGSHTIIDLLESNQTDILSLDAFLNSSPKSFERIKAITNTEIKNYNADIRKPEELNQVFATNNIEAVIHFAAFKAVHESEEFPDKYYENNVDGLKHMLACCEKYGVNRFIFSSSCTVYGEPDKLPVNEDTPQKPASSVYGKTKQIGEEVIQAFAQNHPHFNAVILRYFNPIGAHVSGLNGELPLGTPNNLVPFLTQSVAGLRGPLQVFGNDYNTRDGSCIRDYIHVMDIAHAHTLALTYLNNNENSNQIEIFNLGTGNGVSVFEVINAFESVTGIKVDYQLAPRRKGDVVQVYSDSKKANEVLQWYPKYSLEDSMLSAWKWQQNLE